MIQYYFFVVHSQSFVIYSDTSKVLFLFDLSLNTFKTFLPTIHIDFVNLTLSMFDFIYELNTNGLGI
jgi:hypothetical protein